MYGLQERSAAVDKLQTYLLPYDPKYPVVCFDEAGAGRDHRVNLTVAGPPLPSPGRGGGR
jgi:hypothetical protein